MATPTVPIMERGEGVWAVTEAGERYLDAVSGTFNLPLGYSHPAVVDAVVAQARRAMHVGSSMASPLKEEFTRKLAALAPAGLDAVWLRDITGSTAVECAVRITQKATGRPGVLTFFYGHHGQTLYTTGLAGPAFRREAFPATSSIPAAVRAPAPYCLRCFYDAQPATCGVKCVDKIDEILTYAATSRIACLIVEPVFGNGGNIVPPAAFFPKIRRFCSERGILLVADEVQTGLGRTGHMFASVALGLDPDIIVLAKGLGGCGVPLAAVLMRGELDVLERHEHSFTSGAHLLGLAAGIATLEVISSPSFLADVRRRGRLLGERLRRLSHRHRGIGEVRGLGLMWGLEMVTVDGGRDVERANRIVEVARDRHRLLLRTSQYGRGNVVKVRPALVASEAELDEIVDRLDAVLGETAEPSVPAPAHSRVLQA
ncbi:aminotransferase class III-fold pyridoxal phosphate-dependent enzyme [Chelatococcus sp. SYSU_G07232]|uniref:Aminotransferase class III-fold pyridoxal phosphate-dependent enzyme n=1 Tax=Chelatococcus albus TaxID=3047466 RepID=A0ABT7AG43_9HYPH|nr:aminotransferase class III-fold pyridoxal phosphate-dependent enzyme [Chelatococcus sp. SYSU_G07232]MDJ1158080.1 aminotransferase class III-fold pyridoxal phosphate-dependent enzyme [Chelatococcus sp. SYSU_G07232]